MSDAEAREITITRMVDAPRELVFDAWTQADRLAQWYAPEGFDVPEAESDPRPGGAIRIVMRASWGPESVLTGTYRELDRPSRIVTEANATDAEGRIALEAVTTVTLTDRDGTTELTVHERATALIPEAAMMLAGMEVGLLQSLRKLDDVVTGVVDRQIVVTHTYEAPREVVFDAFTDDDQLQHWWGPNGFSITTHAFDLRPGGIWRFTMHGPDGVDYPNEVTYEEIARPELLRFEHTAGPDSDTPGFFSTITFDEFEGSTIVAMRSVFESASARDLVVEKYGAIEGGRQTLERLENFLKTRHD
jgi:uncharacterized protein YndB with AHSA1/START domain